MTESNDLDSQEIISSRIINATREKVFRAFSDPDHLKNWWGPKGFKNTFSEFDLRPGGNWRFVMHGPDGTDYPNQSLFLEIVDAERIVFKHVSAPSFKMTITFEDLQGKTKVTWQMLFETAAIRNNVAKYAKNANEENFDRLEAELAKMA